MIPADIDAIEFKTTRVKEGYDQDEVDNFLDRVRDQWRDDRKSLEACRTELARVQRKLAEAQSVSEAWTLTAPIPTPAPAESATRILEAAQRTADDVTEIARADAEGITAAARAEADKLLNDARVQVYRLKEEAGALSAKRDSVRKELLAFHRKHMNELEETGG